MDKIFLRFVTYLNPVLEKTGVNTDQLYQILRIKLMMDNRRPNAMYGVRRNAKNEAKVRSPWYISISTLIIGLLISMVLFITDTPYIGQTFYFIIFMVMMSLVLISDFTTVLLDVRDQFILLPRPVNDRTVTVSRILHISIYVLRLALLLGLPAMVMIGFIDGPFAVPLFFVQVLEATFLSVFTVNIIYLMVMQSVNPQRFKDIISYFQIGFSVLIFAAYYLLPRLVNVSLLKNINLLNHWWAYALPPVWITALNELLIHPGRSGLITGILAIAGFTIPLLGLWLIAKVLAPGFNKRLAVMATSDGNSNPAANIKKARKFNLIEKLSNMIAPDPVENAGFRITWKLAARTREFKMKVYPAFAYVPIYFVYFAMSGKDRINHLQDHPYYVFLIYACTFILSSILMNISMSSKYKSAWVYYALPIREPGKILSGMYKAIITLYFFPYCLFMGIATVAVWGTGAVNDVLLAFLISVIYGMLMALFMVKGLPFSRPVVIKQAGGRIVVSLMLIVFIGGMGIIHYMLMKWETVIWILIIPFLFINWLMFHYYKKQTWDNIELSEV